MDQTRLDVHTFRKAWLKEQEFSVTVDQAIDLIFLALAYGVGVWTGLHMKRQSN